MNRQTRFLVWIVFTITVLLVLGIKARQFGWLLPKPQLGLNGQPAVLVFVKHHGVCECEQFVNGNARAQAASWTVEARHEMALHQIDIEQRPDLVRQYKVLRAPSMLILDAAGEIVWRQDDVITDQQPLDLPAAEDQIIQILASGGDRDHE